MFVSIDLETTGTDPLKDKIIEFGAVKFDLNGKKETLQFLINPGITLPQIITHITGITDADLKNEPSFNKKKDEITSFIADLPIIGHNIKFDADFLKENGIEMKNPLYDTFQFSSIVFPSLPSYSLEILTNTLGLKHKEKHRALDDAIATMELFLKLGEKFQSLDEEVIKKIQSLCGKTNWPLKNFLLTLQPKTSKKTVLKTIAKKLPQTKAKFQSDILSIKKTALFEIPPPYTDLIISLAKNANKDSYIALPHQLFREILPYIPDTVAKIDAPQKYISIYRLKEFEQKSFFEDYEFTSLLKCLIWIGQTQTGLMSEISLFHEEKPTIHKINIDENFTDIAKEPFFQKALEKDKNLAAICSHQYLIEKKPKIKDLILIDLDRFIKNIFFENSVYLSLDIFIHPLLALQEINPENQTIKSLIAKSTILFAIFGLIFEKYNDRDMYSPRVITSNVDVGLKEWSEAKESIINLIKISKDLAEILTPQTHGWLQNWKNSLKILDKIFKKPDLDKYMTWIEQDMNKNTVIRKSPYSLKNYFSEIIKNCKNYKIVSENLDLNNNCAFIRKIIGLEQEIPLIKSDSKIENLEIYLAQNVSDKEANTLLPYLKEKKGRTAIIFNSKQQLQYFTLQLAKPLKEAKIKTISQMTGSLGKIKELYKQDPDNSILFITPNFWENFENYELIQNLIIHKIPFDPPSDPFIITTSQNFTDPFSEFQVPKAVFSLKKMINRLNIFPVKTKKEVIILDPRISTKDYSKPLIEALNSISPTKTINL